MASSSSQNYSKRFSLPPKLTTATSTVTELDYDRPLQSADLEESRTAFVFTSSRYVSSSFLTLPRVINRPTLSKTQLERHGQGATDVRSRSPVNSPPPSKHLPPGFIPLPSASSSTFSLHEILNGAKSIGQPSPALPVKSDRPGFQCISSTPVTPPSPAIPLPSHPKPPTSPRKVTALHLPPPPYPTPRPSVSSSLPTPKTDDPHRPAHHRAQTARSSSQRFEVQPSGYQLSLAELCQSISRPISPPRLEALGRARSKSLPMPNSGDSDAGSCSCQCDHTQKRSKADDREAKGTENCEIRVCSRQQLRIGLILVSDDSPTVQHLSHI